MFIQIKNHDYGLDPFEQAVFIIGLFFHLSELVTKSKIRHCVNQLAYITIETIFWEYNRVMVTNLGTNIFESDITKIDNEIKGYKSLIEYLDHLPVKEFPLHLE